MSLSILAFIFFFFCAIQKYASGEDSYQEERYQMVERQIKGRGVRHAKVLEAMKKVPRHEFVGSAQRNQAYEDHPLPIGEGQTISQPYIVAFMTELLSLPEHAKVLEVGTGSGYQAAVLGEVAGEVYTIEIVPKLAKEAERTLKRLDYTNIFVKEGDGYLGWPEQAPFDGIIVTAAPENIPKPLIDQLKEGGKMVIPMGRYPDQSLYVARKVRGEVQKEEIFPVSFVPMVGLARESR